MGALAIGGAIAGGALSAVQQSQRNSALRTTQERAARAAKASFSQSAVATSFAKTRLGRQQSKVLGTLRTAGAARGIAGRSQDQTERAAEATGFLNNLAEEKSLAFRLENIAETVDQTITNLQNQKGSPFLAGITGGLGGLSLGTQLSTGLASLKSARAGATAAGASPTIFSGNIPGQLHPPGQI